MNNFFVDSDFYETIEDLLVEMEIENTSDAVEYIEEDLALVCEKTTLEPMFKIGKVDQDNILSNVFEDLCTRNDDRFPEDSDSTDKKIKEAIKKSIDFKKLKELLPSLYYPNGEKFIITKKDILTYLKENNV